MPGAQLRRELVVVLDGEKFELRSKPADLLAAERFMARQRIANPTETAPMQMSVRVMFAAFARTHPDHDLAGDWDRFLDHLDDAEDLTGDGAEDSPDPTRPTDGDG